MRLLWLATIASLAGSAASGQTLLGQSQLNGGQPAVVVPQAPAVVAAPPTKLVPSPAKPLAPPPGLVETPVPPPTVVQQSSLPPDNAGVTPVTPNAPLAPASVPTQAVSPSGESSSPVVSTSNGAAPATATTPMPSATAPAPLPPNDVPPAPEANWVYGHVVELGVLNKVEGSTTTLTVPVGGQVVSGDLTVSVQACVNRPPGALPNSAAFITLQSTDAEATPVDPVYRGWIVKSLPGASDAENADEAFRMISCS